jgi:hypothetical protein
MAAAPTHSPRSSHDEEYCHNNFTSAADQDHEKSPISLPVSDVAPDGSLRAWLVGSATYSVHSRATTCATN